MVYWKYVPNKKLISWLLVKFTFDNKTDNFSCNINSSMLKKTVRNNLETCQSKHLHMEIDDDFIELLSLHCELYSNQVSNIWAANKIKLHK